MVTNYFWGRGLPTSKLTPAKLLWRDETECNIAIVYARSNSATNASTSCKSIVKIGLVISAENSLESGNCAANRPQL